MYLFSRQNFFVSATTDTQISITSIISLLLVSLFQHSELLAAAAATENHESINDSGYSHEYEDSIEITGFRNDSTDEDESAKNQNLTLGSGEFLETNLTQTENRWIPFPVRRTNPVALHHYRHTFYGENFYTINWTELESGTADYAYLGVAGYIFGSYEPGATTLFRYVTKNGSRGHDHFLTTDWSELGGGRGDYIYEGAAGFIYSRQHVGTVPWHRYYRGDSNFPDHFYTIDFNRFGYGALGYIYEGIQGYIFPF